MTRLSGIKAVASALDLSPRRIEQLASQPVDPLPLRLLGRTVWILSAYLEQWEARRRDLQRLHAAKGAYLPPSLPVLVGRAAIAARAGVTVKQIERWSSLDVDPLPILGRDRRERLPGGSVWIYDTALRDWLQRRDRPYTQRARRGTGEARIDVDPSVGEEGGDEQDSDVDMVDS